MAWAPFAVVHLCLAAGWVGAMAYSLLVVQPRVGRFFPEPVRREEFTVVLAHGNRWPVLTLAGGLVATAAAVAVLAPALVAIGFVIAAACQLSAAAIFGYVSWRHWPARVFALPSELPGYRRRLRRLAATMTGLVGAGYLIALTVSVVAD